MTGVKVCKKPYLVSHCESLPSERTTHWLFWRTKLFFYAETESLQLPMLFFFFLPEYFKSILSFSSTTSLPHVTSTQPSHNYFGYRQPFKICIAIHILLYTLLLLGTCYHTYSVESCMHMCIMYSHLKSKHSPPQVDSRDVIFQLLQFKIHQKCMQTIKQLWLESWSSFSAV